MMIFLLKLPENATVRNEEYSAIFFFLSNQNGKCLKSWSGYSDINIKVNCLIGEFFFTLHTTQIENTSGSKYFIPMKRINWTRKKEKFNFFVNVIHIYIEIVSIRCMFNGIKVDFSESISLIIQNWSQNWAQN